jgi:hypothetical protein
MNDDWVLIQWQPRHRRQGVAYVDGPRGWAQYMMVDGPESWIELACGTQEYIKVLRKLLETEANNVM